MVRCPSKQSLREKGETDTYKDREGTSNSSERGPSDEGEDQDNQSKQTDHHDPCTSSEILEVFYTNRKQVNTKETAYTLHTI